MVKQLFQFHSLGKKQLTFFLAEKAKKKGSPLGAGG